MCSKFYEICALVLVIAVGSVQLTKKMGIEMGGDMMNLFGDNMLFANEQTGKFMQRFGQMREKRMMDQQMQLRDLMRSKNQLFQRLAQGDRERAQSHQQQSNMFQRMIRDSQRGHTQIFQDLERLQTQRMNSHRMQQQGFQRILMNAQRMHSQRMMQMDQMRTMHINRIQQFQRMLMGTLMDGFGMMPKMMPQKPF